MFTKFGLVLSICSQDIEQKQILTSNKGSNTVANLRKTMIYNTNVDLVNGNVYTKLGLKRSIRFNILSKNSILTSIEGRNSVENNSSKLSFMSSIPARMKKSQLKIKALQRSQDLFHYKSMGIFPDAQGQLTP